MLVGNEDSETEINVDASTSQQEECDDFDDDDFGNFEEATPSNITEGTRIAEEVNEPQICIPDVVPFSNLLEVIEQLNLNLRDTQNTNASEGCDNGNGESEAHASDLCRQFDICDSASPTGSENVDLRQDKSIELWSRLCNVEEANALNFLWNNSLAYLNFLRALQISVNKPVGFRTDHSTTNSIAAVSCNSGNGTATPSGSEMVDSLSVPPASFDWQMSGLSNPLTGSSMPAVHAVLACDYFNDESPTGQVCNGESLLKKELEALGLGDELPPNNVKTQLSVNIQELIERNSRNNSAGNSPLPHTSPKKPSGHSKGQNNRNHEANHSEMLENLSYGQAVGQRLAAAADE